MKELIQKLKKINPEAEVNVQEYTGCNHSMLDVTDAIFVQKGLIVPNFDHSSLTSAVDGKSGKAKKDLVFLKNKV